MNRRAYIAATALAMGVAGCLGDDDEESDEPADDDDDDILTDPPAYARWLQDDDQGTTIIHVDFRLVDEVAAYRPLFSALDSPDGSDRFPALADVAEVIPANAGVFAMVFFEFAGEAYPFISPGSILPDRRETGASTPVVAADSYTTIDDVTVVSGTVALEELTDHPAVREIETFEGYSLFESSPVGDDDRNTFAATEETLLFHTAADASPSDQHQRLYATIQSGEAGVPFEDDDRAWLLERCDTGAFVLGSLGWDDPVVGEGTDADMDLGLDDAVLEEFAQLTDHARSVLMVADRHESGRVTRSGIAYEEAGFVPPSADLESVLAGTAADSSTTIEDNRIFLEAVRADD